MRTAILALFVLVCLYEVTADYCRYPCTRQQRYSIRCGWHGWSRCARYRSYATTCTKYCKNGGWSAYRETARTTCSVTCGTGTLSKTMTRTCNNPAPLYGGAQCTGASRKTESMECSPVECPINGQWSEFSDWEEYDECSAMCGGGKIKQWKSRTCTNPTPAYGGDECVGAKLENQTIACNTDACGAQCPDNTVTYFSHPENDQRYYQCDNGVAMRQDCAPTTTWNQTQHICLVENAAAPQIVTLAPESVCNGKILVADETDCTKYYMCASGRRVGGAMPCAPGLAFNPIISTCDHIANVAGC